MEILTTQVLLLSLLCMGAFGRKKGLFTNQSRKTVANLIYYFLLPGLFFSKLAGLDPSTISAAHVLGVLLPMAVLMVLLLLLRVVSLISREVYILLNLSICFGSNAFFGIPFYTSLFGTPGQEFAVLTSTFTGMWGLFFLTLFFETTREGKKNLRGFLKLFFNPLILSLAGGIAYSFLGLHIPLLLNLASLLGQAAGAPAIMLLGMFLVDNLEKTTLGKAFQFALFRFLALPLATIAVVCLFFPTPRPLGDFLLLQGGMPAAISTAVFAERYAWNRGILANIVIISSILSFFSLSGLYLLRGLLLG